MRNSKDKTQKYKANKAKVSEEKELKKNKKEKKKHRKLKRFILICFVLMILVLLIGIAVFCGIFFSDKWKIEKKDLVINNQNSIVYDIDGNKEVELTGDENRKIIAMADMGAYLPNAFIAIEDERYYTHYGIDIKRTGGAIVTYVLNKGKSSFGGSTITQQLVKNIMKDDATEGAAGVERKIREWSRAYQIEKILSKSQILELYLNKIFMGSTVYGVESASQYYFSKSAKDLSLAEAAFLAGINHSPNSYNPFVDDADFDDIKNRTKIVIGQMKKLRSSELEELKGLKEITDEDFEKAIAEVDAGLKFKKGNIGDTSVMSYHTAAAIEQIANQLAEEKEIKYEAARDMIKNGGYRIYTTQNAKIQKAIESEYEKKEHYRKATTKEGKAKNEHLQSAMVIIDYKKGYVVGTVGGLGKDTNPAAELNRATQVKRQPGSAIKPLAAIGPALEEKIITAATMYDDSPTTFGSNSFGNSTGYPGVIPVRAAIERSSNVVNIKVLSNLGTNTSIKYLNEFGLTDYTSSDASLTLTLGGTYHGTNALQMAAAYGTIANGGEYITPTFYTKVEDSEGNVVLEPKQEKRRVLSEQTAYVLTNILKSPVNGFWGGATATSCWVSGMETAAKTGTTSEYKDKWTCGMTPYYSAAVWVGYDTPEEIRSYSSPATVIWGRVMRAVHKGLKKASFEKPEGISSAKICKITGKVATEKCEKTYTEVFVKGTVPDKCEGHEPIKICKESKLLATEYCTDVEEKTYAAKPEKEINAKWKTKEGDKYKEVTETCTIHTEDSSTITIPDLIGKTELQAKLLLKELKVTVIYDNDSEKETGVVLEQSIAEGEKVKKGATITITVNKLSEGTNPPSEGESGSDDDGGEDSSSNTNQIVNDTENVGNTNEITQ